MWTLGLLELRAKLADGGRSGKRLKGRRLPSGGYCCSVTQSLKAGVHHKPPGALKTTGPYTVKEQLLQESSGPLPEGIQKGMLVGRATAPTTAAASTTHATFPSTLSDHEWLTWWHDPDLQGTGAPGHHALLKPGLSLLLLLLLLFSCSVVSNSLRPHGLQHATFPCLSPSPRVCSNSRPLRQ